MCGLYIHIPFCASRCIYCGFYSSTLSSYRSVYVDALCREMELRKDYLNMQSSEISTIYIGGGTPSQLKQEELEKIFSYINKVYFGRKHKVSVKENFSLSDTVSEITMEVNPDDVTFSFAESLKSTPVNRISMGVQTFSDERLRFLRRRHNAQDISNAIRMLRDIGIRNISIDLMFGFPDETLDEWERDIDKAISLDVEHISAYSLMYEEGTSLFSMLKKNEIREIDEETSLAMYRMLADKMASAGYEHYEISNFAKRGFRSIHNSSYWRQIPYIGIGASAHSYDIKSRQWNVADIRKYIASIRRGEIPMEREVLDEDTRYNDMITTAMRTKEGIDMSVLDEKYLNHLIANADKHIKQGTVEIAGKSMRLTEKGLYISDSIMSDMMFV